MDSALTDWLSLETGEFTVPFTGSATVTGGVMLRQGQKQLRFAKERPAGSFWLETSCSSCSEKSFCFCRSICGLLLLLLPPSNRISHSFNYCPQPKLLRCPTVLNGIFAKPIPTHKLVCFVMFRLCVGFINWFWKKNLGCSRLTVETCSWFSLYWLRRELTRDDFPNLPQILNCKALMMTALLISLNLISITLYKEILSKAKLTIDLHCVGPVSPFRLHPSNHIFWTQINF